MKKLVLFDFDGTLTYKDSFLEFIKFYCGTLKFYVGFALHLPALVLFKLKIIPNWKAKEIILKHFFKGEKVEDLNYSGEVFAKKVIPGMLRPRGLNQLQKHIAAGDEVFLVSASCENWLKAWADKMEIGLISTKLEVKDDIITGRIDGRNCYGPEKVNRINGCLDLATYSEIIAYGDSTGDKEMLELAGSQNYRVF